jgi:hypothetical protein
MFNVRPLMSWFLMDALSRQSLGLREISLRRWLVCFPPPLMRLVPWLLIPFSVSAADLHKSTSPNLLFLS